LRRLALDLILERSLEDVDDLLPRMRVPRSGHSLVETDDHLDGLASWGAEVVPLEIGAGGRGARLLTLRRVQGPAGPDDQQHRDDSPGVFHRQPTSPPPRPAR